MVRIRTPFNLDTFLSKAGTGEATFLLPKRQMRCFGGRGPIWDWCGKNWPDGSKQEKGMNDATVFHAGGRGMPAGLWIESGMAQARDERTVCGLCQPREIARYD